MVKIHPRRYLIEIRDAKGAVLSSAAAHWGTRTGASRSHRLRGSLGYRGELQLGASAGARLRRRHGTQADRSGKSLSSTF
jgi:hypothetical protein